MSLKHCLYFLILSVFATGAAVAQQISAPQQQSGTIIGTVIDVNNGTVPGATVVLEGPSLPDRQRVVANDNGFFQLSHLNPGIPYRLTVSAKGFADWTSPALILKPGQYLDLANVRLQIAEVVTTVSAALSAEEIATQQVKLEEQQRVLGFIPNFYVVYDHNAVPLTPKLKFRLALKTMTDPVTFLGSAFVAGIDQAADTPDYEQGLKGYGQRFGANYANGLTDIMVGGAILPSLLHQDPRYFYQGTGTNKSRVSTPSLRPSSARETTDAGSRTIQAWEAIWPPAPSPTPIILRRIAARAWCFRPLALMSPPTWPTASSRSSSCASSPPAPKTSRNKRQEAISNSRVADSRMVRGQHCESGIRRANHQRRFLQAVLLEERITLIFFARPNKASNWMHQ